jgi:hypothetical protein
MMNIGNTMETEKPFENQKLFGHEWAHRDALIRKPWLELKSMFDDRTNNGWRRPEPTVRVDGYTDKASKQALTDVLAKIEELRFVLTEVCNGIPDETTYTPEFYKKHYHAYQSISYPDEQRLGGFCAKDKMESAKGKAPFDIITDDNLKDAAWLLKVCLQADIGIMTAANDTYLARMKKLSSGMSFINHPAPKIEEKMRFTKMLNIATSTMAIRRHEELHPPHKSAGAAKKQSTINKIMKNA